MWCSWRPCIFTRTVGASCILVCAASRLRAARYVVRSKISATCYGCEICDSLHVARGAGTKRKRRRCRDPSGPESPCPHGRHSCNVKAFLFSSFFLLPTPQPCMPVHTPCVSRQLEALHWYIITSDADFFHPSRTVYGNSVSNSSTLDMQSSRGQMFWKPVWRTTAKTYQGTPMLKF